MHVLEAIKTRASTRAFLTTPVTQDTLHELLNTARFAPSGTNTQPWQVAVVNGASKQRVCNAIAAEHIAGEAQRPDYQYYPKEWSEPYKSRRFACGMALYGALAIERQDKAARQAIWLQNYHAFGAPVVLFFFIDKQMEKGSWFDYGMFYQNVMLAATGLGLATCPQAALAEYPDVVRAELGEAYADKILVCGMAVGYPESTASINQYRTERAPVNDFTHWFLDKESA
jgi:nitroreductase